MISAEVQKKFVSDNKMRRFFVNPESPTAWHSDFQRREWQE